MLGVLYWLIDRGEVSKEASTRPSRRHWTWYVVAVLFFGVCVAAFFSYRILVGPLAEGSSIGNLGLTSNVVGKPPLHTLFIVALLAGLVTFGGAYTTIPFVRGETLTWLSSAVSVMQFLIIRPLIQPHIGISRCNCIGSNYSDSVGDVCDIHWDTWAAGRPVRY
jgi:hypothetical protein